MARGTGLPTRGAGVIWRLVAALALVVALVGAAAALPGGAAAANCTIVNTNDSGAGSLRAAIGNSDGFANCDTIDFILPGAAPWTITLTSGELAINRTLTITGPGADKLTVSGNDASRVFNVSAGTVVISDLTVADGSAADGGGIFSTATLTVARATIRDNAASNVGGGIETLGGTLTITDSTIVGNTASSGHGGVLNQNGTAILTNCTIAGNSANVAAGLMTLAANSTTTTTLTNCTVAGNTGNGISTYSNSAGISTTRLQNSVVADNTGSNFRSGGLVPGHTSRVSLGYNVSDDNTGSGFLTATGDLNTTNPLLAALGNYGGTTQTRALLPGSPAIDRVPAAGASCPAADQRNVARPQPAGGACDSGAFESRGFAMSSFGGNNQSAVINTAFPLSLVAGFSSSFGEPIVGGAVTFTGPPSGAGIQGSPLTATIAANGRALANVTANGTAGGPYIVTATAAGAAGSESYSLTNLPVPTTLVADDATGVYTGTVTLRATLTATGGAGIAGKTIAFTLNGNPVGSAATDGSGVAALNNVSLAGLNAGSYPASVGASFAGDASTVAANDTAALTVNKAATALTQVSGNGTYGDPTGSVTATLRRTNGGGGPVAGATVQFTINGVPAGSATTNAQGVATLASAALPAGLNAGTYATAVGASYAGDGNHLATSASGPLRVARRILWVKPTDRTVGLYQPNPPTTPPAGCVQQQAPTSACWLELANGSTFVNGDDWADLSLGALRFQYNRNPPTTNATEFVGKTYRITAIGAVSANYDIRYQQGTLTVVAAP